MRCGRRARRWPPRRRSLGCAARRYASTAVCTSRGSTEHGHFIGPAFKSTPRSAARRLEPGGRHRGRRACHLYQRHRGPGPAGPGGGRPLDQPRRRAEDRPPRRGDAEGATRAVGGGLRRQPYPRPRRALEDRAARLGGRGRAPPRTGRRGAKPVVRRRPRDRQGDQALAGDRRPPPARPTGTRRYRTRSIGGATAASCRR